MLRPAPRLLSSALIATALGLGAALLPSRVAIEPTRRVAPPRRAIEVAITVDDLPRALVGPARRSAVGVLGALARAFARHRVAAVTGFLNGVAVSDDADRAALEAWVSAGHQLGNHTFSHLDPARVSLDEYLEDLARNEPLLASLAPTPSWRVFRYPYLQEGSDAEMHRAIRSRVLERGYRVAPVTIDFKDWVWSPAWARCSAHGDVASRERLRELWREHARESLRWSDRAARQMFGRGVRQVLLIHALDYTAERIDDLLADYAAANVRFIPLERALEDPVLALDPEFATAFGAPHLHKVAFARTGSLPPAPEPPFDALERLCRATE